MLRRAASNAYSWWWAGHIRTKQSKWMEQSLQDMEEKVTAVLKVIEEDGDSFAKRAEMYYKKRPELIEFVEEFYRAYRALAERYDHISTELQNANNTIASVCPEQAQFAMDDEEEDESPTFAKRFPPNSKANDHLVKDFRGLITSATNKREPKRSTKAATNAVPKSGLTEAEGLDEIHKLQKQILALQTEKEFVKGSYESGLAKYQEIDDEIKELQEKVYSLQDEFGEGRVIEDDEARTMMVATALQSCKETLTRMQEKQERSVLEAQVELKKVKDAREKLDSLKNKFLLNEAAPSDGDKSGIVLVAEQEGRDTTQKIKEQFEAGLSESLTVTEMVEKVDELVNKVISLENAISSQTALIQRLRAETDELLSQIQTLEEDKATLVDGKNYLKHKLMEMEEKFHGIQDLNQNFQDHNNNLQTRFTEAHCNLDCLSENVHCMKPDEEEFERDNSSVEAKSSKDEDKMPNEVKAGQVFVVANASERDNSPAEVKSTKQSEEQKRRNLDASDGLKNLQSAKQAMVLVSDSLPKEEDSVVKLALPKASGEKGEKLVHFGGCTKGGDAEAEAREELKSERDNSPAEVNSTKESEEQERSNLHASDSCKNLQSAKQAMVMISDSLSKEEDSVVKLALPKESEEEREKLVHSGGCTKGGDAESEAREEMKSERDNSPAEVKSTKECEEQERRNLHASDACKNLQSAKQAMIVVSDSLSKEEESAVKVALPNESEEEGDKIDHSDGCSNGGDAESAREDLKLEEDTEEHESVKTSTNEGVHQETCKPSEKCEDLIEEDKVDKQAPSLTVATLSQIESKEQEIGQEEEPDWKQLFSKGMGDREKSLLTEYTATLRKYKDTKKRLAEVEANNKNIMFEIMLQLKELKSANAMKDEDIRALHQKLSLLQTSIGDNNSKDSEKPIVTPLPLQDEDVGPTLVNQSPTTSAIEEKFRMNIDGLLEENLEFWFRFSTAFHEIQKFETGVKDLVAEVSKLAERQKQEESSPKNSTLKSDVRPLYKHLTEIQNELTIWVENSVLLKEELKKRFSSLCEIEEEITKALKASAEEDDFSFTSYQAVKFQGEILNMKQENNKVADELQAGSDRVTALQIEIERSLSKLSDDWELSGSKIHQSSPLQQSRSWSGVPLRSFIFGAKLKKEKTSIFSYVHPTLHRKFSSSSRSGSSKK
ncbi:hypothetical protein HRI_003612600 [Hibiscus trionum]|uniref:NAB domain-containing protein n=1 Tax=Hibiscus trionum TaxID=183268 RepID=A0A9W7IQF0_HIBTR|nr:hypothetical protein HRI_003612600 [Hibiscus trionum]